MLLKKYSKIKYSALPSKAKESYNFQKASAVLAEFGFITNLLKYDWYGVHCRALVLLLKHTVCFQTYGMVNRNTESNGWNFSSAFYGFEL